MLILREVEQNSHSSSFPYNFSVIRNAATSEEEYADTEPSISLTFPIGTNHVL